MLLLQTRLDNLSRCAETVLLCMRVDGAVVWTLLLNDFPAQRVSLMVQLKGKLWAGLQAAAASPSGRVTTGV
jgi:hypothetical protein